MATTIISRGIVTHLDFNTSTSGGKYTLTNIKEDEKLIYIGGFALSQKNENQDFIWPASVTVTRNNNYTFSIQGVNALKQEFNPPILIDCNENWKIEFDNYEPNNTSIHLFGTVREPSGRNVNY